MSFSREDILYLSRREFLISN